MKETDSLKNLKEAIKNLAPNVKGLVAKKIKVKPTRDVIKYIKETNNIVWDKVGTQYDVETKKRKPIYSDTIIIG